MICPTCKGQKYIYGCFPPISRKCDDCAGIGELNTNESRISIGKQLREDRLKQNMSLREFCITHKLDPIIRPKQERGII